MLLAPIFAPTIDVMAVPIPKIRGIIRNSTLEPMPYPARASVPKVPTKPVNTNIVPTVRSGEADAGIATSKILENRGLLKINFSRFSIAGTEVDKSFMIIIDTIIILLIKAATAAPATPSLGNPYHPKINPPERSTCRREAMIMSVAGKRIFPIPLKTALKLPDNHISIPPKKRTEQYK